MDTAEDFGRKWGGCFVRLKEQNMLGQVGPVGRGMFHVTTKAFGPLKFPYKKEGLEKIDWPIPIPGYYQLGAHAWFLQRTGMRQFRRGLGPKNYILQSPINNCFGNASTGDLANVRWDVGLIQLDYAEADAILHQMDRGMPEPQASVRALLNKNNKVFVSLALNRMFAASLSPFFSGLHLYLWNTYVADIEENPNIVRLVNTYFEQEVSDFVRDHLKGFRFDKR